MEISVLRPDERAARATMRWHRRVECVFARDVELCGGFLDRPRDEIGCLGVALDLVFLGVAILPISSTMQTLVSLTDTSSLANGPCCASPSVALRPLKRTSFHHQPEAQHLKSSAIHKLPADYPICSTGTTGTGCGRCPGAARPAWLDCRGKRAKRTVLG